MGVKGAAEAHPIEVEDESDFGPERRQLRMTGLHPFRRQAVPAPDDLLHGTVTAGRRPAVQLERAVRHGHGITVLEVAEGHAEPGQAEGAPGAGVVGPHVDLHVPPSLRPATTPSSYQSCAGHPSAAAARVQQVPPSMPQSEATAASSDAAAASSRSSL